MNTQDQCHASAFAHLIGAKFSQELVAQLKDKAPIVRVIHPGDSVTLDYRPERLNVYVGNDGLITEIKCG